MTPAPWAAWVLLRTYPYSSCCRLTADLHHLPCRWDEVFALNAAIYVAGGAAFVALADTERVFE